ncbi:PIN domain-containing protein [Candidatus Woesearchaeota archaeon]|jgi:predicted nucleic acid-binding protein|nr:PIN domain-containing protein [Candidatus Woesearchaeota archaeon]MBT5272652.1 PIN domain-containing protein [Candidatus Woesearchaeota archaeon]MBT6041711.1 PIN domain-containing protein [Candidatus Woesearchaeota archaeon]MBT6337204.1 PIN domain-containing protein [Candidatus Woesearchaeota archaeon]MBT7928158.1 PIN domain-containing protein [Candidatus Woesearchaeota archaeon]
MYKTPNKTLGDSSEKRYLLDTCIWRDFYQARYSKSGNPLGKYAAKLIAKIVSSKEIIIFSEFLIKELKAGFDENEILNMLNIFFITKTLIKIEIKEHEVYEAESLSEKRNLPFVDCLNAVHARDHNAILVSQDKHIINDLSDIAITKRPQHIT